MVLGVLSNEMVTLWHQLLVEEGSFKIRNGRGERQPLRELFSLDPLTYQLSYRDDAQAKVEQAQAVLEAYKHSHGLVKWWKGFSREVAEARRVVGYEGGLRCYASMVQEYSKHVAQGTLESDWWRLDTCQTKLVGLRDWNVEVGIAQEVAKYRYRLPLKGLWQRIKERVIGKDFSDYALPMTSDGALPEGLLRREAREVAESYHQEQRALFKAYQADREQVASIHHRFHEGRKQVFVSHRDKALGNLIANGERDEVIIKAVEEKVWSLWDRVTVFSLLRSSLRAGNTMLTLGRMTGEFLKAPFLGTAPSATSKSAEERQPPEPMTSQSASASIPTQAEATVPVREVPQVPVSCEPLSLKDSLIVLKEQYREQLRETQSDQRYVQLVQCFYEEACVLVERYLAREVSEGHWQQVDQEAGKLWKNHVIFLCSPDKIMSHNLALAAKVKPQIHAFYTDKIEPYYKDLLEGKVTAKVLQTQLVKVELTELDADERANKAYEKCNKISKWIDELEKDSLEQAKEINELKADKLEKTRQLNEQADEIKALKIGEHQTNAKLEFLLAKVVELDATKQAIEVPTGSKEDVSERRASFTERYQQNSASEGNAKVPQRY